MFSHWTKGYFRMFNRSLDNKNTWCRDATVWSQDSFIRLLGLHNSVTMARLGNGMTNQT